MSLRSCQELWAHAKNVDSLHTILKNYPQSQLSSYFDNDKTFKIEVETFCRHFTQKEKIDKIEVSVACTAYLIVINNLFICRVSAIYP